MKLSHLAIPCLALIGAMGTVPTACKPALALIVAPSTYTNAITVQGEAEGTEFDDWASSGIPVAATDPVDNPGFIDIDSIQIANDNDFIYLHVTYHDTNSAGTLIAFDTDQDPATGFDIFSLGEIGSEFGYINDFPFSQANDIFNTNVAITGGPIGNGGALIFPFFDQDGTDKEYAIPRDAFITFPSGPAFPNSSFNFMVYSDQGLGDISETISYTLAEAPALAGDFDGDTDVDGADFLVWQQELGTTLTAGDLLDWQNGFGTTTATATLVAVPEPGGLRLACLGLAGLLLAGIPRTGNLARYRPAAW